MPYRRIGPTPWVSTTQPASVSTGEPQLPTWTSSQPSVGACSVPAALPDAPVLRGGQADILPVPAGQRQVAAVDPAREQRHALVVGRRPGQRADLEGGGSRWWSAVAARCARRRRRCRCRSSWCPASSTNWTRRTSSMPCDSAGLPGHSSRSPMAVSAGSATSYSPDAIWLICSTAWCPAWRRCRCGCWAATARPQSVGVEAVGEPVAAPGAPSRRRRRGRRAGRAGQVRPVAWSGAGYPARASGRDRRRSAPDPARVRRSGTPPTTGAPRRPPVRSSRTGPGPAGARSGRGGRPSTG